MYKYNVLYETAFVCTTLTIWHFKEKMFPLLIVSCIDVNFLFHISWWSRVSICATKVLQSTFALFAQKLAEGLQRHFCQFFFSSASYALEQLLPRSSNNKEGRIFCLCILTFYLCLFRPAFFLSNIPTE